MSGRDERLASNEVYFRDVNEGVEEQVRDIAGDDATFNVLCECAALDCGERIALTPAEYAAVHADPRRFVVVPGHANEEIEDVVSHDPRYDVVRKRGAAGDVAEESA